MELLAVIFSLLAVWFTRKQNIWCWLTGLIGTTFYFFLFKHDQSWANMWLQIVFFLQGIYGWIAWRKEDTLEVTISSPVIIMTEVLGIVLFFVSITLFSYICGTAIDKMDIVTTGISLVAMFATARKKLEAWVFWGIANLLYVIFFISTQHYLSAGLYSIFLINAFFGFKEWKNSIKVPTS